MLGQMETNGEFMCKVPGSSCTLRAKTTIKLNGSWSHFPDVLIVYKLCVVPGLGSASVIQKLDNNTQTYRRKQSTWKKSE